MIKRIIIGTALIAALSACGTYTDVEVTPLDDNPTPSCVAISSTETEEWDGGTVESEKNYTGRYCRED
jgi:hypothetical protein